MTEAIRRMRGKLHKNSPPDSRMQMPPEVCPNCGALVPREAKACPSCGSDEETGWSDSAHADNLGIPDEHFSHDEFVKDEFGGRTKPRGIHWFWWLTALCLILLFLLLH